MPGAIKLVKKQKNQIVSASLEAEVPKDDETSTREVIRTIKSWVADFKDRKRYQRHSLPDLPVLVMNEQIQVETGGCCS